MFCAESEADYVSPLQLPINSRINWLPFLRYTLAIAGLCEFRVELPIVYMQS